MGPWYYRIIQSFPSSSSKLSLNKQCMLPGRYGQCNPRCSLRFHEDLKPFPSDSTFGRPVACGTRKPIYFSLLRIPFALIWWHSPLTFSLCVTSRKEMLGHTRTWYPWNFSVICGKSKNFYLWIHLNPSCVSGACSAPVIGQLEEHQVLEDALEVSCQVIPLAALQSPNLAPQNHWTKKPTVWFCLVFW